MTWKHKVRHAGPNKPRMCGGKRCYGSKSEASIVKHEQELLTDGLTLSIYHCTSCGSYHLTRSTTDPTNYPEADW